MAHKDCPTKVPHKGHKLLMYGYYDDYYEWCGGIASEAQLREAERKAELREAKALYRHNRKMSKISARMARKYGVFPR